MMSIVHLINFKVRRDIQGYQKESFWLLAVETFLELIKIHESTDSKNTICSKMGNFKKNTCINLF